MHVLWHGAGDVCHSFAEELELIWALVRTHWGVRLGRYLPPIKINLYEHDEYGRVHRPHEHGRRRGFEPGHGHELCGTS